MLSVPNLDDLSYEKLVERARSRIPTMTEEWTDFNEHDPGITTMETFAWLTDTLNYYMDATGEAHRRKYFKLLGIESCQNTASCTVEVKSEEPEFIVPRGTRMQAGNILFEAPCTYRGTTNQTVAIYREVGNQLLDITHLAGADGGYAEIFSYDAEQKPALYIGFCRPIRDSLRFYVQVKENERRNPFSDRFSLVTLKWEYFNGRSWQSATITEDETCDFLRSGFITVQLEQPSGEMENPLFAKGHYLRCTLVENQYDMLPLLGKISPCAMRVEQTATCAQALEYVYDAGEVLPIDYYIEENTLITVAVETEEGYETWFDQQKNADSLCDIQDGEAPWQKQIYFFDTEARSRLHEGQKILVLLAPAALYGALVVGNTEGCAQERLDFSWNHLYALRLALVHQKHGRNLYELWEQCEDLDKAGYADRVFAYDEKREQIVFGDGIHGMQPQPDAIVMAVMLQASMLDAGNVRKGQINQLLTPLQQGLSVESLEEAHGGHSKSTVQEMEQQLAQKLNRVTRAVTKEDYINLVQQTPGLMIDAVNVITAKEYAACYGGTPKPNTVLLAVKPHTHDPHAGLDAGTRALILQNLEQYRLLTTHIELVSPQYVGVRVFGRIALKEDTPEIRKEIQQVLQQCIDETTKGVLGRSVAYGEVFSALEMLDTVKNVLQLSFELEGKGAEKNEHGDILVHPDGLTYLKQVEIEFLS